MHENADWHDFLRGLYLKWGDMLLLPMLQPWLYCDRVGKVT